MPKAPNTKNPAGLLKLFLISAAALGLIGCGGGGSGSGRDEPAPQTLNGVIFTIYGSGGPVLTMIRSSGDATGSGETGAVRMDPNPSGIEVVSAGGVRRTISISPTISGATYVYTRTSPEGGRLVVRGTGQVESPGNIFLPPVVYEYFNDNFSRTYDMVFATDGSVVTTVISTDYDTEAGIGGGSIGSPNGSMRVVGSAFLPNGWNVEQSAGVILPKLYPDSITGESLVITIASDPVEVQDFNLVISSYTRLSNAQGDFLEKGVGNVFIDSDPTPKIINYAYAPDPKSTNRVKLTIVIESLGSTVYTFTFTGNEAGTFVDDKGQTGTFEFPFLE